MKVVACGSREFSDTLYATSKIIERIQALPLDSLLIHGDAQGADRLAGAAAALAGLQVLPVPARWSEHVEGCRCAGRSWCFEAGKKRNLEMLDMQPELVVAFWNGSSTGTMHTVTNARGRGIETEVLTLP